MNGNQLITKHSANFDTVEKSNRPGVLVTLRGPVTGWKQNRNGRTYSRDLWVKALDSDYVKEQVALNHFVGEADHPEERLEPIIQNMSHAMRDFEFDDENEEVIATIDILDTPCGNMLKTLYDYSGALSFSTRGSGDVLDNGEVDPDTYQLFAIDAVLRPSYATATVRDLLTESESLNKDKDVNSVLESYSGNALKEDSDEKTFVKTAKDCNGTFFNIFKTKDDKFVDANGVELTDDEIKRFGLSSSLSLTEDLSDEEIQRASDVWKRLENEVGVKEEGCHRGSDKKEELAESVSWDYYDNQRFHDINAKYLPSSGEGDTLATQAVTAVNKLVYKWYNDGDVYDNSNPVGMTGWANDLSSYANWLAQNIDGAKDILDGIFDLSYGDRSSYENLLRNLNDLVMDEEYLDQLNSQPKDGSVYNCSGDYSWDESRNYDDEDEDDYYESDNSLTEDPKAEKLNEYGDTKDYSEEIQKLFKQWFKDNASLGIRAFQSLTDSYYLDIEVRDKGEGPDRKKLYKAINNSPFVEVEDYADEIGNYIADHIPALKYVKFTFNDKSFFSDDETAGDITFYFVQQIGMPDFGENIFDSEKLEESTVDFLDEYFEFHKGNF